MSYAATASWWFEGGGTTPSRAIWTTRRDGRRTLCRRAARPPHRRYRGQRRPWLALSKELARRDATVHLVCRNRAA